jgi:DNA polymerase-3 subunit chi
MAEIQFYHLLTTPLEAALPRLLTKALEAGYRIAVKCADAGRMHQLDELLWAFDPDSFLPHGTTDAPHATEQPILLTPSLETLPNQPRLLVVTDGTALPPSPPEGIERVLDIFDGSDDTRTAAARARWKDYREAGHSLSYFRQQQGGGWKKEA